MAERAAERGAGGRGRGGRVERLERGLRDAGMRLTRQRAAILRALAAGDDHPGAAEVLGRARRAEPSTSLATVYRTLAVLEREGLVGRHAFDGGGAGAARYELGDAPHHDHLIDVETGAVIEFRDDRIEALQAEIARELGYEVIDHRLELFGRRRRRGPSAGGASGG